MVRFVSVAGGLAVMASLALSTGVATAGEREASASERVARPVLICASDSATRRAFTREYGAAPVFVTAQEALSIRPTDAVWSSPRCMTSREHSAYQEARSTMAVVR